MYFGAQMKGLLKTSEPIDNPRMVLTLIDWVENQKKAQHLQNCVATMQDCNNIF